MEHGYRIKFHTNSRAVTVLLILPYVLEEALCAGIIDDWLEYKLKNGERIQCQLKTAQGKRKSYRPISREGLVLDRISLIQHDDLIRERQGLPVVSLTSLDKHFIGKKRWSTTR
ncbi:hypothetical protein [Listeria goaensis]|uniref:hypothetical protein n=1 Tax=Listeria goaensis TaxID=1649188 RepID=UPI000B59374D|nr:hypothetical protein [Listeria goaensis]